jgi:hypothetical protein
MKEFIKELLREGLLREASGGKYHVRFNLSRNKDSVTGKPIFMTWQIRTNGIDGPLDVSLLDFDPNELINSEEFKGVVNGGVYNNFDTKSFHLELGGCTLVNDKLTTAYQIKCQNQKTVVAGVDANSIRVIFGSGNGGGTPIRYNPREVPHWLVQVNGDPFSGIEGEVIGMGRENKHGDETLVSKNFEDGKVYCSCTNKVVPPPPTKYFYMELNGSKYVKIVSPDVNDYKINADVYKVVDGMTGINLTTKGGRLYIV